MGNLDGSITANDHLRGDYWLMELALEAADIQPPQPGRFIMVQVSSSNDPLLRRPFGIHDFTPHKGSGCSLKILYQVVGRGTKLMTDMRAGQKVDILGPLGKGFTFTREQGRTVILAGGIGGAPLLYLARRMVEKGLSPDVYVGGNTFQDILGASQFKSFGLTFKEATMDGSLGHHGTVVDLLIEEAGREEGLAVYACGPWAMLYNLAQVCRDRTWSMEATIDAYMSCGMGLCLGCAVKKGNPEKGKKYLMACRDGPVFALGDIVWEQPT